MISTLYLPIYDVKHKQIAKLIATYLYKSQCAERWLFHTHLMRRLDLNDLMMEPKVKNESLLSIQDCFYEDDGQSVIFEDNARHVQKEKIIQDSIYGSVIIEPFIQTIIDTPQFQRLRKLKQLGACQNVYPAAQHTRFEHSIGVYFLTNKLLQHIEHQIMNAIDNQTELQDYYQACKLVKIAALCHDIGHGPLSHLFEEVLHEFKINITHEEIGCLILKRLLQKLQYDNEKIDIITILIRGKKIVPQPIFKKFLFLNYIVSNSQSSLDTDKLDYLIRDSDSVNIPISIRAERIIQHARIFKLQEKFHLGYLDNVQFDLSQVFSARYILHRILYQHPKTIAAELNIQHAFSEACKVGLLDLKSAIDQLTSSGDDWFDQYQFYTDDILIMLYYKLYQDKSINDPKYANFVHYIKRINSHILEKNIYKAYIRAKQVNDKNPLKKINDDLQTLFKDQACQIVVRSINYGKGEANSLSYIPFFKGKQVVVTRDWVHHVKNTMVSDSIVGEQEPVLVLDSKMLTSPMLCTNSTSVNVLFNSLYNSQVDYQVKIVNQVNQTLIQPLVFNEIGIFIYMDDKRSSQSQRGFDVTKEIGGAVKEEMKKYLNKTLIPLEIVKKLDLAEFVYYAIDK